jgi:hypothetical protein
VKLTLIQVEKMKRNAPPAERETLYPNPMQDEIWCNSYPYISYRLKEKAITALKLNQKPILYLIKLRDRSN